MLTKYIPRKITWNVNHSIFWITCHCSALLGAPQIISYGGRGALHFLFGGPEMGELERNISTFLLKKISADQMKAIKSFVKHLKVFFFPHWVQFTCIIIGWRGTFYFHSSERSGQGSSSDSIRIVIWTLLSDGIAIYILQHSNVTALYSNSF